MTGNNEPLSRHVLKGACGNILYSIMTKYILLLGLGILSFCAGAQEHWAIKGNLTDLAVGRYSLGIEKKIQENWSVALDVDAISKDVFMESYHPWYPPQNARKRGVIVQPQVRWYPGGRGLQGSYVSLDGFAGYASYAMEDPLNGSIHIPEWTAMGASLHWGHQVSLGRFLLDGFAGCTWANEDQNSLYQESTALFPPPSGFRASGGLRLGLRMGN